MQLNDSGSSNDTAGTPTAERSLSRESTQASGPATSSGSSSFVSRASDSPNEEQSSEKALDSPICLLGEEEEEEEDTPGADGEPERPSMPRTSSMDSMAKEKFRQWVEWDNTQLERRKTALIGKTVMGKLSPKRNTRYFVKWNIEATDTVFIGADKVEAIMGPVPRPGTIVTCVIKGLGPGHVQWNKQHPYSDKLEVVPMDEKHPLWRRRQREIRNKEKVRRSRSRNASMAGSRNSGRISLARSRSGTWNSEGQRRMSTDKPRRRSIREGPPMGVRRSTGDSARPSNGSIGRVSFGDAPTETVRPRRKSYAQQNWTLSPSNDHTVEAKTISG